MALALQLAAEHHRGAWLVSETETDRDLPLQRPDRERDRLRGRALSGAAVARGDGRARRAVAIPLPAHVQALGRHQPEALPAVRHAGARQAAARRRCQRARGRARCRPVGPEPAARSVRHLRCDDARRVQGAGRAPGDPLGPARRAARPGAARRDRARRLLAQLRREGDAAGDRRVRARMAAAPRLVRDQAGTADSCARGLRAGGALGEPLPLLLRGTNFQIKVWEALLRIPFGRLVSYRAIAQRDRPAAARCARSAARSAATTSPG